MTEEHIPWLKRLPAGIEKGQRAFFEAVDIACDMIKLDFQAIIDVLASLDLAKDDLELTAEERFKIIGCVWSIVDRLDSIRLIMHSDKTHMIYEWSADNKVVIWTNKFIRNQMDHLGSNWQKLQQADTFHPIFGMVSFCWYRDSDIYADQEGSYFLKGRCATVLSLSSFHHDFPPLRIEDLFSDKLYAKVGNIKFHAFKKILPLEDILTLVSDLQNFLNRVGEQSWLNTLSMGNNLEVVGEVGLKHVIKPGSLTVREDFNEAALLDFDLSKI